MPAGQPPGSTDQPVSGDGRPACLYLLRATADGLYRIGVATDWPAQAPGLGVGVTTRVIGLAPVNAPAALLRFLRHRLAAQRLGQGDWYRLDPEAVAFLEALLAKAQDDFSRAHPQIPLAPWSVPPLGDQPGAAPGATGPRAPRPAAAIPRPRRSPSPPAAGRRGRGGGPLAEVVELLLLTPLALMLAGLALLAPPVLVGALSLGVASISNACALQQQPGTDEGPPACRSRAFWLGFWVSLPAWGLALLLWLLRSRPDRQA